VSSPARPKALKAALIAIDATASALTNTATVFAFPYNPEKLVRTLTYFNPDGTPTLDNKAPPNGELPVEIIYLTLELDATDQLDHPEKNASAAQSGLIPSLATLESMMSPSTSISAKGSKVVLFSWGPKRLLATRLVSMKVTEEAFDLGLNPIRASVDLCMRVMPLSELKNGSIGNNVCRNQQILDATLARIYKLAIGDSVLSQISGQTATAPTGSATGVTGSGMSKAGTVLGVSPSETSAAQKKSTVTKKKTQ
jgi:hypothetical protein